MSKVKVAKLEELTGVHENEHDGYEYIKKTVISKDDSKATKVSVYEIPPCMSGYPYHYHLKNEETFYIISGEGLLKTPDGEKKVTVGDILFFPADQEGAHKLTNTSDTEKLIYLDVDTIYDIDVCIYPDSNKIGIYNENVNKVYKLDDEVDYYEGE